MSFTPVVRVSRNVLQTIKEFAQERALDSKLLDFELLSYETLMRSSVDAEYRVLEPTEILCEALLIDPLVSIIQEYEIRIFLKGSLQTTSTINFSIASDKYRIKAIATLGVGTNLVAHKGILKELRDALWKKKLLAGFFIDFFEPNLVNQLKKIVTLLGFSNPLTKEIKFPVAIGINPKMPVDAKLVPLYLEKKNEKNLIDPVEAAEEVLRYLKPQSGNDGRACDGKYIKVREPRQIDVKPLFDETISAVEGQETVCYYANESGYVVCENELYTISKRLILESANFKSSANIDSGQTRDISVHVGGNQKSFEDAITQGVQIDVGELNVQGSVGANVKIATNDLNIEAQTHSKSKMDVANTANIKIHKGDLHANEANIEILEIGKVRADTIINIKQMLGGEAIAPIVRVDEVLSNCVIIASECIEIGNINGNGIKLIIDPHSMESYHHSIEDLQTKLKTLSTQIRLQTEELSKDQKAHVAQLPRMKQFQQKIVQAQKAGNEPMKQDLIRMKQFKKTTETLKQRAQMIEESQQEFERLEIEQQRLYEQDLHAKIVHHGVYDGHTQISFVNPKTQEKVVTSPVGARETITVVIGSAGREIKMA